MGHRSRLGIVKPPRWMALCCTAASPATPRLKKEAGEKQQERKNLLHPTKPPSAGPIEQRKHRGHHPSGTHSAGTIDQLAHVMFGIRYNVRSRLGVLSMCSPQRVMTAPCQPHGVIAMPASVVTRTNASECWVSTNGAVRYLQDGQD